MIKYLLILNLLFIFGCSRPTPKQTFPIPSDNDINEIVKAIVLQDSLALSKTPISVDLIKVRVTTGESLDPDFFSATPKHIGIICGLVSGNQALNKNEENYFFFQNSVLKSFKIDTSLIRIISLTSRDQQEKFSKEKKTASPFDGVDYFEMSIPIFTINKQSAYVKYNHLCTGLGGSGWIVVLKKVNGKWIVTKRIMAWVS